jgi:hypothetical protein
MSTSNDMLRQTSTPDLLAQEKSGGIAGVLREPLVLPNGPDQLNISYHWETDDDRHTYLYIHLHKLPEEQFVVARVNIDSEEIKGQGDALWTFIGEQLQAVSDRGNLTVYDEIDTNPYSRRFPENDPKYVKVDEDKYVGTYTPTPQDSPIKIYPSGPL